MTARDASAKPKPPPRASDVAHADFAPVRRKEIRKDELIKLRVTAEQKETLTAAAEADGVALDARAPRGAPPTYIV